MYHTGNPLQLGGLPSPQQLVSVPIASSVSTSVTWTNPPVSSLLPLSQSTIPSLIRPADNAPLFVPTTTVSGSLSLSLSSDPIPAKVVHSIRSGRYVEMRDLLGDNMALTQHLESIHGYFPLHILPGASRPRLREVTTLPQWIYCFLAYLAVKTTDPLTRDQLAYVRLIVSQAQRHCGQGWLEYDCLFRRQSALDPSLPWNMIQPGLQATTILGQHPGMGHFCTLCRGLTIKPASVLCPGHMYYSYINDLSCSLPLMIKQATVTACMNLAVIMQSCFFLSGIAPLNSHPNELFLCTLHHMGIAQGRYTPLNSLLSLSSQSIHQPAIGIDWPLCPTPICAPLLANYLRSYPDARFADWAIQGVTQGYHVGFSQHIRLKSAARNLPSSVANIQVVSDYVKSKSQAQRIIGPITMPALSHIQVNP